MRAGKLRVLSVTTDHRSPALPDVPEVPDVPTMGEAGLPNFSVGSWRGLFRAGRHAAQDRPEDHRDVQNVLKTPEVRAKLQDMGFKIAGGSPAELAASLRVERPRDAQAIKTAGIEPR